jgi:hypothetical protein
MGSTLRTYWGVDDGEGEVASAPVLADVLVSEDPLVLPDALVSTGAPAPELGCARMDLTVLPPTCAVL